MLCSIFHQLIVNINNIPQLNSTMWILRFNSLINRLLNEDLVKAVDFQLSLVFLQEVHYHKAIVFVISFAFYEGLERA